VVNCDISEGSYDHMNGYSTWSICALASPSSLSYWQVDVNIWKLFVVLTSHVADI